MYSKGQTNHFLTNVSAGTRASSWADTFSSYAYLSFFLRGEYNYKDLYYADFSVRTDASSRFGKDHRWGRFWSLGFMWNAKQENFLKYIRLVVPMHRLPSVPVLRVTLKFRTGRPFGDWLPQVRIRMNEAGIYPAQSGNEELGWEQTWLNNVGVRLGFWNRANLNVEFYHKKTTKHADEAHLIHNAVTGEGYRWKNVGAMVNRGVEITADGDIIRTKDFVWNVSANVSYNMNKLTGTL